MISKNLQLSLLKIFCFSTFRGKLSPEALIQKQFVDQLKYLSLDGKLKCVWFSVANENSNNQNPVFGAKLKALGKINGTADMIFLWHNGSGCIEFKSEKGRLTESQKNFQFWCKELGVNYEIAKDVESAINILNKWNLIDN